MTGKNNLFLFLLCIISVIAISGCLPLEHRYFEDPSKRAPLAKNVENLNERLRSGLYVQKIENLLVIVDDTASMDSYIGSHTKSEHAGNLVTRIAKTIPNIELVQAIRVYGPKVNGHDYHVSLSHGAGRHPSSSLKEKLLTKTVPDTLFNPLGMALEGAYHELKLVEGRTAIVVISDFKDPVIGMIRSGELIKQYYEGRVCLYPIVVGSDGPGRNSAENLVAAAGCGITAMADTLTSGKALADLMEKVLFEKQEPQMILPITPSIEREAEEKVEEVEKQEELSYKKLLKERVLTVELKTEFDFDKSNIKEDYLAHLNEIAEFMKTYRNTVTTIEGHTCSIGTEKYNLDLSTRRANNVKNHLASLGISPERLNIAAYGETMPLADNSTPEGRRKNRRAVAVITTTVKEYVEQKK